MVYYIDGVLLYVLTRMNGERTVSGALHLLNGKKSSQTIQDAKLFQLSPLFGMLKKLKRNQIEEALTNLRENRLVEQKSQETLVVNSNGEEALDHFLKRHPFPEYLNGWKYHAISDDFWQRISLYMQTLSHSMNRNMNFYPVVREETVQEWVRKHFPLTEEQRIQAAQQLYTELSEILAHLPEQHAKLFVLRLSGFHRTGLTLQQCCAELGISEEEGVITFYGVIHAVLTFIQGNNTTFPILSSVLENRNVPVPLTASTRNTYSLLQKGMTIQQIMGIRKLKQSTIEDHLVEIAINVADFSIDRFVSIEAQEDILRASKEMNSQRLKTIREHLNHKYGYFEIRLTLCKVGV